MSSIYNLKIFIQTNPQQELAAKVAAYSFIRYGFNNVELIKLHDVNLLKDKFGENYLRSGRIINYDQKDLQSFTFLRFMPPKIHDDFCLVIDPDIFAVKDPSRMLEKYVNNKKSKIFCTKKNGIIRSEVIILNCKNFSLWNFNELIANIFSKKIDYNEIINFEFLDPKLIGELDENLNIWDDLNDSTILLHTTNRITQPWKEGLDIDFKYYISKYNYFKNLVRKLFGSSYNYKIFEKKYQPHPNSKVLNFVEEMFKEAYIKNAITSEEIKLSLDNKYLSKIFIERLKI